MADHASTSQGATSASVLVWLPRAPDATVTERVLRNAGVSCFLFDRSPEDFDDALRSHVGPLLIDEAALTPAVLETLRDALDRPPVWSDPPIILIRARGRSAEDIEFLIRRHMTTSMQRPIGTMDLVSVARSALQSQRRQFMVRDLLVELDEVNQQLRRRRDEQERLARSLTAAERRERERIARVLHDNLQQLLVGASFQLQRLRWGRLEDAEGAIDKALDALKQSTKLCRTLTAELHPPGLRDAPLKDVMEWLADHLRAQQGLGVSVQVAENVETSDPAVRAMLFEAARELLFNVAKHAGVDQAAVAIEPGVGATLRLVIADAGVGAAAESLEARPWGGMGLLALRERIQQLGGGMEIDSPPGQGCRVEVTLPISASAAEGSETGRAAAHVAGEADERKYGREDSNPQPPDP